MMRKRVTWLVFYCLVLSLLNNCISTSPTTPTSDDSQQHRQLWSQWYQQWRGTPYRYGGTSLKGVDCSALVQDAYRYVYQLKLPRTTSEQRRIGHSVSSKTLAVGDLLFFKPDRNNNHVGVYLGNGRFVHASSSKGVTISSLDNAYWLPRLVQARRVRK